jgi:hypothetical protein
MVIWCTDPLVHLNLMGYMNQQFLWPSMTAPLTGAPATSGTRLAHC